MQSGSAIRRRRSSRSEDSPQPASSSSYFTPSALSMLEYLLFLVVGSIVWIAIAWRILVWQKFPFFVYPVEVGFIFVGPIILLGFMLHLADRFSK
jgi:hypothetical protein